MAGVSFVDGHIDGSNTCVICGKDIPEGSQVCVICGDVPKKNTNYDRIRNMSVEEMAVVLYDAADRICFENCKQDTGNKHQCRFGEGVASENCINCIKQWLETEVTDT